MLTAAATTIMPPDALASHGIDNAALAATGLVLAAGLKSSQFPLTPLFARSMEGPTPSSALGYAGNRAPLERV